jgi:hypothetical protein
MIKKTITLALLLFFVSAAQACVFMRQYNYYPNGIDSVVGTIQGKSRNTIEIYDEQDKRTKGFIDLTDRGQFKLGERVRLYYYPVNRVVQNIKRETSVPYRENGQNLGYILKSASYHRGHDVKKFR